MSRSTFAATAKSLINYVKNIKKNKNKIELPCDCYFIDNEGILCSENPNGEIRHPYFYNGLTLWACASGNIYVEESNFKIFLDSREGKEPYVGFFMGKKLENAFMPISLLGTARQLFEGQVTRYTIFMKEAVYYLTLTEEFSSVIRLLVDDKKRICFSVALFNESQEVLSSYLSSYFNPLLKYGGDNPECKWFKSCRAMDNGFIFSVTEAVAGSSLDHYAFISREQVAALIESTTSRNSYCGGEGRRLGNAIPLKNGAFCEPKAYNTFTDISIAGDIISINLLPQEELYITYTMAMGDDEAECRDRALNNSGTSDIDAYLVKVKEEENAPYRNIPVINLKNSLGIEDQKLNRFLHEVFCQVEFCSRAKNYVGPFIGVRDIFQQLEASLMWIPQYTRKKILEALNFVGEDGRVPRQYSYPPKKGVIPEFDLRQFIDQGIWIITTIYEYISFTGDYSILDEKCGYYRFNGKAAFLSDKEDTCFEHLLAILEYLIGNVDEETHCLHILFGDWNDALDGLGRTTDPLKEFGSGVSVMATLQLYRNIYEVVEILEKTGYKTERIGGYRDVANDIKNGLLKHAIVFNEKGERKIVHGWGDKLYHKVASFKDIDGQNRDGLTSNAFWILSGAISWDKSLLKDILHAYSRLDSKYGLKTFEPYFSEQNTHVGRIIKLPKGTAENAATYIHATLFAIWSLYRIGEAKTAWNQILKILPITHQFVSTTPFVMPNSYIFNEEKGLDGQSMNDWFTGSGAVLIKVFVRSILGVEPDLDGIKIAPPNFIPYDYLDTELFVKGKRLIYRYRKVGKGNRLFIFNSKEIENVIYEDDLQVQSIYLNNEQLSEDSVIEIVE